MLFANTTRLTQRLLLATLISVPFTIERAHAQAAVFEVVHPHVEEGEIEIEFLNGIALNNVGGGEERSVHEFAIGYGITDYWKLTGAVEVANPEGGSPKIEAFELESLIVLPIGHHSHDEAGENGDGHSPFSVGLFTALEIPTEGKGAAEIGPVVGAEIGPVELVGNLFVEVPFTSGEDPGLAYATQIVFPVGNGFSLGVENHGAFEGLFGTRGADTHFVGPGVYWETKLHNGHVIEPRLAVLFGLNDNSADAILSFNIEYKIGHENGHD